MSQEVMLPLAMAGAGTMIGDLTGGRRGAQIGGLAGGGLGAGYEMLGGMPGIEKGLSGLFGGGAAASPFQPGRITPTSVLGSIPSTMGGVPSASGIQTENIGPSPAMPMVSRSPAPSPSMPSPAPISSPPSSLPSTLPPTTITGPPPQNPSFMSQIPLAVLRSLGLAGSLAGML